MFEKLLELKAQAETQKLYAEAKLEVVESLLQEFATNVPRETEEVAETPQEAEVGEFTNI